MHVCVHTHTYGISIYHSRFQQQIDLSQGIVPMPHRAELICQHTQHLLSRL